jgi:hypothetical protein
MGEMRNIHQIFAGPEGKKQSEDLGVDGKIILECILRRWEMWIVFIWLRIETSGALL